MAIAAHDGIARAVVPAHTPFDGDLVFAASSGAGAPPAGDADLLAIGHAASLCLARGESPAASVTRPRSRGTCFPAGRRPESPRDARAAATARGPALGDLRGRGRRAWASLRSAASFPLLVRGFVAGEGEAEAALPDRPRRLAQGWRAAGPFLGRDDVGHEVAEEGLVGERGDGDPAQGQARRAGVGGLAVDGHHALLAGVGVRAAIADRERGVDRGSGIQSTASSTDMPSRQGTAYVCVCGAAPAAPRRMEMGAVSLTGRILPDSPRRRTRRHPFAGEAAVRVEPDPLASGLPGVGVRVVFALVGAAASRFGGGRRGRWTPPPSALRGGRTSPGGRGGRAPRRAPGSLRAGA